MAKKVTGYLKLQVPAGAANPSPPIGPALGQRGLNIMEFCKAFNAQTQGLEPGMPIPVVITAGGATDAVLNPTRQMAEYRGYCLFLAVYAVIFALVAYATFDYILDD